MRLSSLRVNLNWIKLDVVCIMAHYFGGLALSGKTGGKNLSRGPNLSTINDVAHDFNRPYVFQRHLDGYAKRSEISVCMGIESDDK